MVWLEHSSRIAHVLNYVFQLFAPASNTGLGDFFLTSPWLVNNWYHTHWTYTFIGNEDRGLREHNKYNKLVLIKSGMVDHRVLCLKVKKKYLSHYVILYLVWFITCCINRIRKDTRLVCFLFSVQNSKIKFLIWRIISKSPISINFKCTLQ